MNPVIMAPIRFPCDVNVNNFELHRLGWPPGSAGSALHAQKPLALDPCERYREYEEVGHHRWTGRATGRPRSDSAIGEEHARDSRAGALVFGSGGIVDTQRLFVYLSSGKNVIGTCTS